MKILGHPMPQNVQHARFGNGQRKSPALSAGQDSVHFGKTPPRSLWTTGGLLGLALLGLAACKDDEKKTPVNPDPTPAPTQPAPEVVPPKPEHIPAPPAVYGPYTEKRSRGSAAALDKMVAENRIPAEVRANINLLPKAMLELAERSANLPQPFFAVNHEQVSLKTADNWLNKRAENGDNSWISPGHQALSMSVLGFFAERYGIHKLNAEEVPAEIRDQFIEVQRLYRENLEPVLMEAVNNPQPVDPGR